MPQELVQHQFMIHRLRKPDHFFTLANGEKVILSKPIIKMNSFDALIRLCCDGLGILLAGDLLIKPYLSNNKLVEVLPDLDYQVFDICAYYQAMQYHQNTVQVFLDFIGA